MPTNRSRRSQTRPTIAALTKRLVHLERALAKLTRDCVNERREHDEVVLALRQLEHNTREFEVQFKRIAQLQMDLDEIRSAWARIRKPA
jgi:hypothetical protein